MGKVVPIGCITKLDVPPDTILEAAKGSLEGVVLMGFRPDGELYFASTYGDGGTVLWLMRQCEKRLLEVIE